MGKKETNFDEIVRNGIDWQNRCIYWGGMSEDDDTSSSEFHWSNVERMVRAIHIMETSSELPIEIHMSSPGGSMYDMFRLMDEIESCTVPVHFVGSGVIASAATMVMVVCDFRSLHKNTVIMLHDGNTGACGSWTDVKIELEQTSLLMKRSHSILAANSRMDDKFWREMGERDLFIDANEAIFLGIADMIISPLDRSSMRKERESRLLVKPPDSDMRRVVNEMRRRIKSPLYRKKIN